MHKRNSIRSPRNRWVQSLARWCMVSDWSSDPNCSPGFWRTPPRCPDCQRWWEVFRFSIFDTYVCVGCLTYCIYIIVTSPRKRNWIVQVSDLTLDQTHLVLWSDAWPMLVGVFGLFESSDQTFDHDVFEYVVHLFTYCWCWKLLGRFLSHGTRSLGSDGGSSACGYIWYGIRFAWVEALLTVLLTDVSEQNVWFEWISDETDGEHNRNCCSR